MPNAARKKPIRDAADEIREMIRDAHDDYDIVRAKIAKNGHIKIKTSGLLKLICPYLTIDLKE